jgi:hypothetical protein
MVTNISDGFSGIPKLKFLSMLDHKQFKKFSVEFPANAMNCLAERWKESKKGIKEGIKVVSKLSQTGLEFLNFLVAVHNITCF